MTSLGRDEPRIIGPLPGPKSAAWMERDHRVMSPSYTRVYPLVVRRAKGAMIEDMDGNRFLDFTAGIAVTNAGHSHPRVVAAIKKQSERLIHMSGTDFYYAPQVRLAERLAILAPGPSRSGSSSPTVVPRQSRPRSSWPDGTRAQPSPRFHQRISRTHLWCDVAFRLEADAAAGLLAAGARNPPRAIW